MERSERGSNLVEFALVLPLLVLILAGMADVGRAFNSYMVITNGAREGARAASRLSCYPADAAQRWPEARCHPALWVLSSLPIR
jgi:Flp pilus assembly protein TadG